MLTLAVEGRITYMVLSPAFRSIGVSYCSTSFQVEPLAALHHVQRLRSLRYDVHRRQLPRAYHYVWDSKQNESDRSRSPSTLASSWNEGSSALRSNWRKKSSSKASSSKASSSKSFSGKKASNSNSSTLFNGKKPSASNSSTAGEAFFSRSLVFVAPVVRLLLRSGLLRWECTLAPADVLR
jgi:hypothetical protein